MECSLSIRDNSMIDLVNMKERCQHACYPCAACCMQYRHGKTLPCLG